MTIIEQLIPRLWLVNCLISIEKICYICTNIYTIQYGHGIKNYKNYDNHKNRLVFFSLLPSFFYPNDIKHHTSIRKLIKFSEKVRFWHATRILLFWTNQFVSIIKKTFLLRCTIQYTEKDFYCHHNVNIWSLYHLWILGIFRKIFLTFVFPDISVLMFVMYPNLTNFPISFLQNIPCLGSYMEAGWISVTSIDFFKAAESIYFLLYLLDFTELITFV